MNRLTCSFVAFLSLSTTGLFTHREQEGNPHYKLRQGHGEPPRQSAGSPTARTRQQGNGGNSASPRHPFCSGLINKHFSRVFFFFFVRARQSKSQRAGAIWSNLNYAVSTSLIIAAVICPLMANYSSEPITQPQTKTPSRLALFWSQQREDCTGRCYCIFISV